MRPMPRFLPAGLKNERADGHRIHAGMGGGVTYPAETFRKGIQSPSGRVCGTRPKACAHHCPIQLFYALQMIFHEDCELSHAIETFLLGYPPTHRPNLEWVIFIWNINKLRHGRTCPTYSTTFIPSYRRKPVSQASYSCVCGSRPRLSPG